MTIKSRTLRLPADQAEALEAIARVDDVSVNEEIQRAIEWLHALAESVQQADAPRRGQT